MKPKSRDNFPQDVINISKLQAAYICSNPNCKKLTVAPSLNDEMSVQYCGEVAHITAASAGGPRFDKMVEEKERREITNAIFLCSNCADLVDKNNGIDYEVETLRKWKKDHHEWVIQNLNKSKNESLHNAINSFNQLGGIVANKVIINSIATETIDENKKHDLDMFRKSEAIFREDTMHNLKSNLSDNAKCQIDDINSLEEINYFFTKVGNGFIDHQIDLAKRTFIGSIPPLADFIRCHFDKWPYHQERDNFNIQLHPHYLSDTMYEIMDLADRKKWDHLNIELQNLLIDVYENYNEFRKHVKLVLHV